MDSFMNKIRETRYLLYTLFNGFCMAMADSVPGVSGGTVAFVMGFYDRFITSLSDIVHGNRNERRRSLIFLVKLGAGWIAGMTIAVNVLAGAFVSGIYDVSSLFLGFVIASIPLILKEERKCLQRSRLNILWMIPGAAAVVLLSVINLASSMNGIGFTLEASLYVFIAGILAISAMVLPGISGSTLLMSFGLYIPVITGLKEVSNMNFRSLWLLAALGAGIITGIIFVMRGIKAVMQKHRSASVYAILGMMIGSLYAIVSGPTTMQAPQHIMRWSDFNPLYFAVGCALVLGLSLYKRQIEKKQIGKGKN